MSSFSTETVTHVHHWTDTLFSFRATRDSGFRFQNGQFVMLGLPGEGRPLLRAYSVVSPNYEDELEFLSIKVPDGPLTSRLKDIRPGEPIVIGRKATGTLLADNLLTGRNLYLIGTGTGLAPFLSLIRDPEVYERFAKVVLVHGVRKIAELAYGDLIERQIATHELVGEQAARQLLYYPTVTREPFRNSGRITNLVSSGKLFSDLGLSVWDSAQDRAMLCGSPQMLAEMVDLLRRDGFTEGSSSSPGSYVIEKAFVEK
ncbi:MAG: ferredoxin--NADP reductase [Methylocystis sp.]|nr:ferredoxin--NADP reductase [Methylocystis sp.]MCA3582854.1 ferredoxin--NADP reductase [Methylocystis sp.]MCA3589075.1 ferredoxin--NADP reductase [Methylocystis sp.]MCA3590613.1 ferredoxin--NADP reductase [Methylocystis sp.]